MSSIEADGKHGSRSASGLRPMLWAMSIIVLLLPAVAMLFTAEVDWGAGDFLAAAVLIGTAGLGIELAVRLLRNPVWRGLAIGAVLLAILATWAELAVGIFD